MSKIKHTTIKKSLPVTIKYEEPYLSVWLDGDFQDGIDWSQFENILKQDIEQFDEVVKDILDFLKQY